MIHEQSRSDRDGFVNIFLGNLREMRFANNFDRDDYSYLSSEYDYGSMMHYGKSVRTNSAELDLFNSPHVISV